MPIDAQKPKGQTKRNSPTAGGANPRLAPALAIVKDNTDPQRMGRIFVFVTDNSGTDPDNKENWKPVRFLSPFFGATRPDAPNEGHGDFKGNPSSYGMWMSPPDIGTTVLCLFVDGDMNYGFYIGCVPEPEAMQMVPAIGATDNIVPNEGEAQSYGGAPKLPVTNINTNNKNTADSPEYLTAPKPVHSYSAAIMFQQGILRDPIRGPISSSSQRETPSRVGWGISTPGRPIYDGGFDDTAIKDNLSDEKAKDLRVVSRRGGHTIVMDDGDILGRDNLVRIRTSLGHQITMSDNGQTLMILHSNGQSYIELGKEGTVDIYSTNSINLRTQGDLNFHADNNINLHAAKNINMHSGENTYFNADKEFKQRVGTDYSTFTNGKFTNKVNGPMAVKSGGEASITSGAIVCIKGSKINLNTGSASVTPAEVKPIDKALHTDTLFDSQKGFMAAPGKLPSITSRAPAHTPWANAGQGVDVKVKLDAGASLPPAPSPSVQATNNAASNANPTPVPTGAVASAPQVKGVSSAVDTKTTQALAATAAVDAKTGALSEVTSKGAAVVNTANGVVAAAGAAIPQTAQQLEQAGVIKPGSAPLVNSIAESTGNVKAALPNSVFTTGNLNSYATSAQAQTASLANNLQVAQTGLQNAGVITGAETPTQVSGLVYSAAQNGLGTTIDAVKSSSVGAATNAVKGVAGAAVVGGLAGGVGGAVASASNAVSGVVAGAKDKVSGALADIGKGNIAANISTGAKNALSGLQNSVKSLGSAVADAASKAQGAAAGAFAAIKNSFKPMKAGQPQNLTQLAKNAATKTVASAKDAAKNAVSSVTNVASSVKNLATGSGNIAGVSGAISGISGAASSLNNVTGGALSSVTGSLNSASSVASGISSLPGGASAISSVTNLATGSIPSLPGTANLKSAMSGLNLGSMNNMANTLTSGASNLLGDLKSKASGLAGLASSGLPADAAAQLQSAMGSIASPGSGLKVPTVALNTTDRGSIQAATATQLGDPKIPAPNFSGEPPSTEPITDFEDKRAELDKLQKSWLSLDKQYKKDVKKFNQDYDNAKAEWAKKKVAAGLDPAAPVPEGHPLKAEADAMTADFKSRLAAIKQQEAEVAKARDAAHDYYVNVYEPVAAPVMRKANADALGSVLGGLLG